MSISRTAASARSKKGWRTRRSGRQKVALAIATIAGIKASKVVLNQQYDKRRMKKYQHVWVRPNGERVPLLGFNEKEVAGLRPTLQHFDQHVRRDVKTNLHHISRQHHPPLIPAAGLHIASHKDTRYMSHFRDHGKLPTNNTPAKVNKLGDYVGGKLGAHEDKSALRISPGFTEPKRVWGLDRAQPEVKKSARVYRDHEAILIHELGHSISMKEPYKKDYQKAFDWKVQKSSILGTHDFKGTKGARYEPKQDVTHPSFPYGYHRSNPWEDFAETFRVALDKPTYTGANSKRLYDPKKEIGTFHVQYTKERDHYMKKHFVNGVATGHRVRIEKVA